MIELITEIAIYMGIAALLGLILGYLIWGWGRRDRIAAARAEGAASARTSVDGDTALRTQLENCSRERKRLEQRVEKLSARLASASASNEQLAPENGTDNDAGTEDNLEAPVSVSVPDDTTDPIAEAAEVYPSAPVRPAGPELIDEPPRSIFAAAGEEGTEATTPAEPQHDATDDHSDPSDREREDLAPTEDAEAPAMLLTERPDEVDDLKQIKGVGPVMERVLNEKGLYLFQQVASMTPSDVSWVNNAIEAFPGRIERDRWVEQAQDLYLEKYGQRHDQE